MNEKIREAKARLGGYFWMPCPFCGAMFGGNEWADGNTVYFESGSGAGVCSKRCADRGNESEDFKRQYAEFSRVRNEMYTKYRVLVEGNFPPYLHGNTPDPSKAVEDK